MYNKVLGCDYRILNINFRLFKSILPKDWAIAANKHEFFLSDLIQVYKRYAVNLTNSLADF